MMTSSVGKSDVARMLLIYQIQIQMVMSNDARLLSSTDAVDCPHTCFCNSLSRIVYCSRRGLDSMPTTLPHLTLQLNVNGNHFRSRVLQRANFSAPHATSIEHLYLSDCGIEKLEVNAFADLQRLRWLDLSDNRITRIPPQAFSGLTLQHLFLNGNQNIQLDPGSFDGLVTSGLYLHDCALEALPAETLFPVNGTLVNLWLNGNGLTQLDRRLSAIFGQLSHLRLGSNPLHCGCSAFWLKQLYDRHGGATFRGAEPPTCWTPRRLRARHFDQLTSADLRCTAPTFGNIDAMLDWRGTGRLRCQATGQPMPAIYWIEPSGQTQRFSVRTSASVADEAGDNTAVERPDDSGVNEAVLWLRQPASGLYICVAKNELGNVTLTINVSWPPVDPATWKAGTDPLGDALPVPRHPAPTVSLIDLSADYQQPDAEIETDMRSGQFRPEVHASVSDNTRLFSVSELVAAVVGTHLSTVLLFIVLLFPLHLLRLARRKRHRPTDRPAVCDALLNKSASVSAGRCSRTATIVTSRRWPSPSDYCTDN